MAQIVPAYYVPRDEEDPRYVQSFEIEQEAEVREFFDEFGFVVIRNVLTPEECDRSINDLWTLLEENSGMRRDDNSTWDRWPAEAIERYGTPSKDPIFTRQFLLNRTNPKVYRGFSMILGRPDLLVNHDRGAVLRPTKGVFFPKSRLVKDVPEWKSDKNLHLDTNPWDFLDGRELDRIRKKVDDLPYRRLGDFIQENNVLHKDQYGGTIHLQGGLNFNDNLEEDGGFICVPGFHRHFVDWTRQEKHNRASWEERTSFNFPKRSPMQNLAIRVSMRAGSLVLWDQRLPHGSAYNDSANPRYGQFLKMFPSTPMSSKRQRIRQAALQRALPAGFLEGADELTLRLFGLLPW